MNLTKQIGVFFILSLLMVKILVVPAIFVNYKLRKGFIIQNYCEKKDRPELECDGQCYLAKQIKAAQQEDDRQSTETFLDKVYSMENFENSSEGFVCHDLESFLLESTQNFTLKNLTNKVTEGSIFHPPQV